MRADSVAVVYSGRLMLQTCAGWPSDRGGQEIDFAEGSIWRRWRVNDQNVYAMQMQSVSFEAAFRSYCVSFYFIADRCATGGIRQV